MPMSNKNTINSLPDNAIVRSRFSSCGCHENDVILWGDPGTTVLSRTEGSTSSFPIIVCWISWRWITELSLCKEPNKLCL